MKHCDVCGFSLGFVKFRYADGCICKKCYKGASRNYTQVIRQKNLGEIIALCKEQKEYVSKEIFEVTNRIGNFMLLDKRNDKFCILYNPRQKTYKSPEIYDCNGVKKFDFVCSPDISFDALCKMENKPEYKKQTIQSIKIVLHMKTGEKKEIEIISAPVRMKSYAFKRSFCFAKRLIDEIKSF